MKTLQEFARHPIFEKMRGNPRQIEWCAELLKYMLLGDLNMVLDPNKPFIQEQVSARLHA